MRVREIKRQRERQRERDSGIKYGVLSMNTKHVLYLWAIVPAPKMVFMELLIH